MAHDHFHPVAIAQMFRQFFGEVDGTMLASCTPERDHPGLEAPALISAQARVHQRNSAGQKLMHALLPAEIVNHRGVFAGERLETFIAPRIAKTPCVENEAAARSEE